jgi:hypothetical protein
MTQPKVGQGVARSRGRTPGRVRDELVKMHLAKRRAARWTERAGGQVEESQGRSWARCHTRRHPPPQPTKREETACGEHLAVGARDHRGPRGKGELTGRPRGVERPCGTEVERGLAP